MKKFSPMFLLSEVSVSPIAEILAAKLYLSGNDIPKVLSNELKGEVSKALQFFEDYQTDFGNELTALTLETLQLDDLSSEYD